MRIAYPPLTAEQKQYIREHYHDRNILKMAKHLGTSFILVRGFMVENDLPPYYPKKKEGRATEGVFSWDRFPDGMF